MLRPSFGYTYYQICDSCGAKSPYALSGPAAHTAAENAGWKRVPVKFGGKVSWKDYCPECQRITSSNEEE